MTRRALFAAVLAAFLHAGPAAAWTIPPSGAVVTPTEQVLLSSTAGNVSNGTAAHFIPIGYAAAPSTTDRNYSVFAAAGTIKEIRARSLGAPTGGQTWTVEVMKNGSGSSFNCVISSGSSQKCSATGGSVAFTAGDYGSIRITPSGSPSSTRFQVTVVYEPTTANDNVLFAQGIGFSTSATQGVAVGNNSAPGTIGVRRYTTMPTGGTVDRLFINSNAPGSGTSYAYTVNKSGSTTALTQTISDAETADSDTTHSFSVTGSSGSTAGDDLLVQGVPTSTPASATAGFGVRFIPSCAPCFPIIGALTQSTHATSTFFYPLTGGELLGTATEANNQSLGATMTITGIAVKLLTAPGAGKSQLITLRLNGADTACTVTISDTAVANTASCSISVANDDLLDTSVAPTGSPTATSLGISYLASR